MNYQNWEIWEDSSRNESGRVIARNIFTGIQLCGNSVSQVMNMIDFRNRHKRR